MNKSTSKSSENAYARKYYKKNAKYRQEKIEDRSKQYEQNKKSEASKSKDYYWQNPEYRKYKIKYAKDYRKAHK